MNYFMTTARIGFGRWRSDMLPLARKLWGDAKVTQYICATGIFSPEDIARRLETEISNGERYGMQYWPIFELSDGALVGCCGLRPHGDGCYELGFHLLPEYWGKGYAAEAARAAIDYAVDTLHAEKLFAGHNPRNIASRKRLMQLGFEYTGDEYYAPTGLYHPSYELKRKTGHISR